MSILIQEHLSFLDYDFVNIGIMITAYSIIKIFLGYLHCKTNIISE